MTVCYAPHPGRHWDKGMHLAVHGMIDRPGCVATPNETACGQDQRQLTLPLNWVKDSECGMSKIPKGVSICCYR